MVNCCLNRGGCPTTMVNMLTEAAAVKKPLWLIALTEVAILKQPLPLTCCWEWSYDTLLLTIGAEPRLHATLGYTVLDLLDLARMVGKERELSIVVVFFGTLDSICSHDPLLSRQPHASSGLWALHSRLPARHGLLVPTDHLYSWHFGAPWWLAHTRPR